MNICYINSVYTHLNEAKVSVFDRGYNFADGVYEVMTYEQQKLIFFDEHFARLNRSLTEIKMEASLSQNVLNIIIKNLIRLNKISSCMIYLQISRGIAKRKHEFKANLSPSIFICLMPFRKVSDHTFNQGISLATYKDLRWQRCDIKSISLLPNILAKQFAYEQGCRDALLISEDNVVHECSASNFFIIDKNDVIKTHPDSNKVLPGVTKHILKSIFAEHNISFKEETFTLEEAYNAKSAFITASTIGPLPVTKIDDRIINGGHISPLLVRVAELYKERRLLA